MRLSSVGVQRRRYRRRCEAINLGVEKPVQRAASDVRHQFYVEMHYTAFHELKLAEGV